MPNDQQLRNVLLQLAVNDPEQTTAETQIAGDDLLGSFGAPRGEHLLTGCDTAVVSRCCEGETASYRPCH